MNGNRRTYYATRSTFFPIKGKIYTNENGSKYECVEENMANPTMRNIITGWTFTAVGTGIYCDGKIDWDYSQKGRFEKPRK